MYQAVGNTNWTCTLASMGVSSGKWYWETIYTGIDSVTYYGMPGMADANFPTATGNFPGVTATSYGYLSNGAKYNNNTSAAYGATFTSNDVIGAALDLDNGTLTFYKNGVSQGVAYSGISGQFFPLLATYGTATAGHINFGQRPFSYAPPAGHKALASFNLAAPTIANPANHFAATTYTGNSSTQVVVNAGQFRPDLIWFKDRSAVTNHWLINSITNTWVYSNLTNLEDANFQLSSINSNGFTLSTTNVALNASADNYIAWQWKAGGTAVTNNAGGIVSTVSANPTAGFSVVSYTGTGTNSTIGHGLGAVPKMILVKARSGSSDWGVYHTSIGPTGYLVLNTTAGTATNSTVWNNTSPTSTVFSVGTAVGVNYSNTSTYVAYCWTDIPGYSAFGSYTGNGAADGPFVYTGFRPKYVMVKIYAGTSAATLHWIVTDSGRDTYNTTQYRLAASANYVENDATYIGTTAQNNIDFLSNGFKMRTANGNTNESASTYIYAAFAEAPFKYALAR
jgi:hypothetical protein